MKAPYVAPRFSLVVFDVQDAVLHSGITIGPNGEIILPDIPLSNEPANEKPDDGITLQNDFADIL